MNSSPKDIDIRLGELAVAMETRVHRHVSMEPVRGVNSRDPLDRRTLGERLLGVAPRWHALLPNPVAGCS